jgi:hypothetical protein
VFGDAFAKPSAQLLADRHPDRDAFESRIPNPESRIPNPESRIPNPKFAPTQGGSRCTASRRNIKPA